MAFSLLKITQRTIQPLIPNRSRSVREFGSAAAEESARDSHEAVDETQPIDLGPALSSGMSLAHHRSVRGMKRILGIGVALLVALGTGWVWGVSGRSRVQQALEIAELRDRLLEGRAAVLDARLDIYQVNFGNASRHLEAARSALRAADARLNALGRQDDAKRLTLGLSRIDEAQRRVGQLNQDANALAADAARTIDDVLGRTAIGQKAGAQ
jgi:hypothetical protein